MHCEAVIALNSRELGLRLGRLYVVHSESCYDGPGLRIPAHSLGATGGQVGCDDGLGDHMSCAACLAEQLKRE